MKRRVELCFARFVSPRSCFCTLRVFLQNSTILSPRSCDLLYVACVPAEFNDPSSPTTANMRRPAPLRSARHAPPKKPLPKKPLSDLPSGPAAAAEPTIVSIELATLKTEPKPAPMEHSRHGSNDTGSVHVRATDEHSKLHLPAEILKDDGSEAELGKMRSPLLVEASTARFAPPRARSTGALIVYRIWCK